MTLESLLKEYKNITEEIIELCINNELESIQCLVEKREQVVTEIGKGNYSQRDIKDKFERLHIKEKEDLMAKALREKKDSIKKEMHKNFEKKSAVKGYTITRSKDVFLNTQI